MTNTEILIYECSRVGFELNDNLYTFEEWRKKGYKIKKGEKTFIKTQLWKYVNKKDDNGEKTTRCYLVTTCLFNDKQVEKIEED